MPLLRGVCNPLTTGRRVAADGPPFPPPDITNAASITGQSMPSGLALHQVWSSTRSRVSRSNGSSNRDPAVNRRQLGREHEARQAEVPPGDHRREDGGDDRGDFWTVLIQSIMPAFEATPSGR
jgi:hypothetical protein